MRIHRLTLFLMTAASVTAATLTGLTEFKTDATGAWPIGNPAYNTFGADGTWNLYVTSANSGQNGSFLNSGNAAAAGINVDISVPGTYTFYIFGQGASTGTYGLNLFFNGVLPQAAPQISVFGAVNGTAFSANGASATLPRSYNGGTFPGANTLTFIDGISTVQLTHYAWYNSTSTGIPTADRVQPFDGTPGSGLDSRGYFTLEVTGPSSIPEPATVGVFALGLTALAIIRHRNLKHGKA